MRFDDFRGRAVTRARTALSQAFFQHRLPMLNTVPFISFSFDDFPRSAWLTGGAILASHGIKGTFYGSLGLMGTRSEVGELFGPEDLEALISQGHELGCHSFEHLDPWRTAPRIFESSIIRNAARARELLHGYALRTFSYPLFYPRPLTKKKTSGHFACSRCGGQRFNSRIADVNLLHAFFLERGDEDGIERLIDLNSANRGWLIFATHDIADRPSPYGCTPAFFDKIVRKAVRSGAETGTVIQAYNAIFSKKAGSA